MLNVKEYVQKWKNILKEKISKLTGIVRLTIVQVGDVEASNRYVRNKVKDAHELGIETLTIKIPDGNVLNKDELRDYVGRLAEDCDGIIVQLPLPKHLNDIKYVLSKVPAHKDVDGLSSKPGAQTSCTPLGIMKFIEDTGVGGKTAVVIGRSELVGRPMARLLLDNDYTVTVCHSKTPSDYMEMALRTADLIVCAVGKRRFLDCADINVPVIDVGINFDDEGKMCGDTYSSVEKNDLRTPVPGGVGLLTRCALMENTLRAHLEEERIARESRYEITIREPESEG